MPIDDPSIGKPTARDGVDDLLRGRMAILGLDVGAMERDYREVFENVKRN